MVVTVSRGGGNTDRRQLRGTGGENVRGDSNVSSLMEGSFGSKKGSVPSKTA